MFLVALGVLVGELLRRAKQRREMESSWNRENEDFLRQLRNLR